MKIAKFLRRHRGKLIAAVVLIAPVAGLTAYLMRPVAPQYITATAHKGDLAQTVEAVGTVTSEADLSLQFQASGIISSVLVQEGDHVKAGQRLATLRAGNLSAAVASAAANVQEAQAGLRSLQAGTRPEDLAISQASVENKKAALNAARSSLQSAETTLQSSQVKLTALREQSSVNLDGTIMLAASTLSQSLTSAGLGLSVIDDVFANNDVLDIIVKGSSDKLQLIRQRSAAVRLSIAETSATNGSLADYSGTLARLQTTKGVVSQAADNVAQAYGLISSLPTSGSFTSENQAGYKSTLATESTNLQTALRNLDTALADLKDTYSGSQTSIAAEEATLANAQGTKEKALADINTYQTALDIEQAQLRLKIAGPRMEDIQASEARLKQMQAALARALADFNETILTAPADGTITKVHIKAGEITPAGAAVTMLGRNPFRIEMYASEVDIPKVVLSQSGSIELDAYPGTRFQLRVGGIDPGSTDVQGVAKYLVKLDFVYPHEELKIGMKGNATIFTGERKDVVIVPLRAVLRKNSHDVVRVLEPDGALLELPVITGMEGSAGDVEIREGLDGGETIVLLIK